MSKTIVVTRVGVSSFGKLVGVVNGAIGLVIGSIGAVVGSISFVTNGDYSFFIDILGTLGILLFGILVYPLIAFVIGWLYGALVALIFNLVVGVSGGIELETSDLK